MKKFLMKYLLQVIIRGCSLLPLLLIPNLEASASEFHALHSVCFGEETLSPE